MDQQQASDVVGGILTRNEISFQTRTDGVGHRLRFGSTAVFIDFRAIENDTVVSVGATVLEDLTPEGKLYTTSLERVNELNCARFFAKFCRYENTIKIENDLLASNLQGEELMNSVRVVANLADEWDDKLQDELGGKTWEAKEEEVAQSEEAVET